MGERFDILGLGCAAVDDILYVDAYPEADAKTEICGRDRQCGGLAITSLIAAARLGCRCAYAGTLGSDEASQFIVQRLTEESVDTSDLCIQPSARPIRSTIVVDRNRNTRTILFDMQNVVGAAADWPSEEVVCSSKALLVDHCGIDGMIRAARIASHAGIPIIADLEVNKSPQFHELLEMVDHLLVSQDFALKLTGAKDAASAALALWTPARKAVAVTCGNQGSWYLWRRNVLNPVHMPALEVDTVDTTGCGDVFHGAYAAALVQGKDIPDALQFATIAAGLKAMSRGGPSGIPCRDIVDRHFLEWQQHSINGVGSI